MNSTWQSVSAYHFLEVFQDYRGNVKSLVLCEMEREKTCVKFIHASKKLDFGHINI